VPSTGEPVGTCLTNALGAAHIPTVYFRTRFTFEGDAAHSLLRLLNVVNDGAVYYLNGVELLRLGMPEGPVTYNTLANRTADHNGYEVIDVDAPSLVAGTNVLAVELHQASLDATDLTFGMKLTGILPAMPAVHPRLSIGLNAGNVEISWSPAVGTLESTDDLAGTWSTVTPSNPPNLHVTPASEMKQFYRVMVP
jgi:hypothetical protein